MRKGINGFTLVELLIAISVVSVITVIGMVSFQGGQEKVRDSVRKSDLQKIAIALEIYYQKSGRYMISSGSCLDNTSQSSFEEDLASYLTPNFPKDPKTNNPYCYESNDTGSKYTLYAKLDDGTDYTLTSEEYLLGQAAQTDDEVETPIPTDDATAGPAPTKRVFVTSTTYTGNLGNPSGANAKCQTRANDAELGGIWKAWVAVDTNSPAEDFTRSAVPYTLIDRTTRIADNWNSMTVDSSILLHPINMNEFGDPAPASFVWTGVHGTGAGYNSGSTCSGWAHDGPYGDAGIYGLSNSAGFTWTDSGTNQSTCNNAYPIYCFEQ